MGKGPPDKRKLAHLPGVASAFEHLAEKLLLCIYQFLNHACIPHLECIVSNICFCERFG